MLSSDFIVQVYTTELTFLVGAGTFVAEAVVDATDVGQIGKSLYVIRLLLNITIIALLIRNEGFIAAIFLLVSVVFYIISWFLDRIDLRRTLAGATDIAGSFLIQESKKAARQDAVEAKGRLSRLDADKLTESIDDGVRTVADGLEELRPFFLHVFVLL